MLFDKKKLLTWLPAAALVVSAGLGFSLSQRPARGSSWTFRLAETTAYYSETGSEEELSSDTGGSGTASGANSGGSGFDAAFGTDTSGEGVSSNDILGETKALIWVYVCGQVAKPGVYALPEGSRIMDGIEAAGGFSDEADRDFLNLAEVMHDAQKIYVPEPGESVASGGQTESGGGSAASNGGIVDINHATAEELATLPGIGLTRAEAIIAYREEHGFFTQPEDLMKVSGIGEGIYNRLKSRIRTGG